MATIDQERIEKEERAKKRIAELKGFYIHMLVFVLVNLFLAFINYMTTGWEPVWFLYATLSWSIGVGIHAMVVFGLEPFLGKDWEKRKMKEFMDEENR